jgi:fructokinase
MQSDFVKFNDDELAEISAFMSSPYHSIEENILYVAEKIQKHICVTKAVMVQYYIMMGNVF